MYSSSGYGNGGGDGSGSMMGGRGSNNGYNGGGYNNNGGGGYNNGGGSSNFHQTTLNMGGDGGGFLSQGGGMFGGGDDDKAGSASKKRGDQSMRAVTIRQLLSRLTQAHPDARHELDGHEIQQVTFIARVTQINEASAHMAFRVHDNTGAIDVKSFLDSADQSVSQVLARCNINSWVRIIGLCRQFNNKITVMAYSIRPVTNYNEVVMHMAQVLIHKLMFTKGPLSTATNGQQQQQQHMMQGGGAGYQPQQPSNNNYNAGFGDYNSNNFNAGGGGGGMGGMGGGGGSGGQHDFHNPLYNMVYSIIRGMARTEDGVHTQVIATELGKLSKGQYAFKDAKAAVEWLNAEGHIYCTIDDDHVSLT
ncbi:Replication factor A protein 2 [Sorochytrium milnesiophthora]